MGYSNDVTGVRVFITLDGELITLPVEVECLQEKLEDKKTNRQEDFVTTQETDDVQIYPLDSMFKVYTTSYVQRTDMTNVFNAVKDTLETSNTGQ